MPSTYAHYRMGQEVIKQVSAPARDIIMKHKQLYDIGLHGPDILFYYHPLVTNPVNAIGYGLHERSGKYFFGKAAEIIETASDKEAALAGSHPEPVAMYYENSEMSFRRKKQNRNC